MIAFLAAVAAASASAAPAEPPDFRLIAQDLASGERRVLETADEFEPFGDYELDPDGRVAVLTGGFRSELVEHAPDGARRVRRRAGSGELSPDGRRVARVDNGGHSVVLEDERGRDVTKVKGAFDVEAAVGVAWSPDGTRLAITTPGRGSRLVVLDARTGRAVRRVRLPSRPLLQPGEAWSTDGRRVVVAQDSRRPARMLDVTTGRVTTVPPARTGIWVSPTTVARRPARQAVRRIDEIDVLTGRRRTAARLPAFRGYLVPGPDARRIGFLGGPGRDTDRIVVVPLDGGPSRTVALADRASGVTWSDDGMRIAYTSFTGPR